MTGGLSIRGLYQGYLGDAIITHSSDACRFEVTSEKRGDVAAESR